MQPASLAILVALAACGTREPPRASPRPTLAASPGAPKHPGAGRKSRLVVAIVLDQLPSWVLRRYRAELPEGGALRVGLEAGAYFENSRFETASTFTAPGHASIYTGVPPQKHQVFANEIFSEAKQKNLSVVDDAKHSVLGSGADFAGPGVLKAASVADELERVSEGAARTVSLSLKDRAAVLAAGQDPDLVLWYDWRQPAFTSSTYYGAALPTWLGAWQAEHPFAEALAEWVPADPDRLHSLFGADAAPGEGDWAGFGLSFPHDPKRSSQPFSVFRGTPQATELLLDLARESVKRLALGQDEVPDLLMLSISSTDYVGHVFGPESWEYLDNLQRVDRALGRFLRELAGSTSVSVLITSDHGVAPLPERARTRGFVAERVIPGDVVQRLNRALGGDPKRASEAAVAAYTPPFLYLTEAARRGPERDALLRRIGQELPKIPGIHAGFPLNALVGSPQNRELLRQIRAGVSEKAPGDVFVVVAEHSIVDSGIAPGAGTSHGSPWAYDQFVPVLFWGPSVQHHVETAAVDQLRVAATLSALLGIAAPPGAESRALPGIVR